MKKWNLLEKAMTPDGRVITLAEHDGTYLIRVDGMELMSTRKHASEEALATLTCRDLSKKKGARVLIGGLGLGFTLSASLRCLGPDAEIVVAEIVPAVVAWNRNPAYPLAAKAMADKRVQIVEKDVAPVIRESPGGFDAILIDVDNGPSGLTIASNDKLYGQTGLQQSRLALRPGGCLGIWSAQSDDRFSKFMGKMGFAVETHRAPAHEASSLPHTLFLGRVPKL